MKNSLASTFFRRTERNLEDGVSLGIHEVAGGVSKGCKFVKNRNIQLKKVEHFILSTHEHICIHHP